MAGTDQQPSLAEQAETHRQAVVDAVENIAALWQAIRLAPLPSTVPLMTRAAWWRSEPRPWL